MIKHGKNVHIFDIIEKFFGHFSITDRKGREARDL